MNADTIAENSTNNGVRSLDKYPLLASRELYWMSTTVVFLLACAKPYLVGAILWENQIDLKSLMLMAISNNFSYVRNRMSASIKAVENTIIQPIIGENYLNEYSSKTYVFDNSSIEFLISPYSVYFDHHGDSTMSDVEIAFNHVEQAICNYLFGPVPTKVIGKEIDNHGSTWEHQPRHHKSKIKKVVEEEELRREEEERRKKRDVERSSRANRAAARLAKKHGDIDQDNSKANYSSGEVKEALESNTVDMAIDLIDSEQTSSQEVALGAAEPTFEIPLLVDTSPAPLTTQYHHQIDLLNDVIIFSVINITRIIPVHVINTIQKYDQTYDFGSTLRQCTNPDFLCKSVTIENTDHENSIKKLTISRELVDTSANWIKSAILVDSAVIIERFPQLAAIYLALNSCGVLTHRLSLYNLWDTNNSKAFCNSQSSDIKMYSSLLANIDEVLAFEYNDAMMFRLIKRDNKFTNEVKIVMLIVDELVEWINSSRYENRTLSRLIDCIFSDLSRDDSKVLSCKLFLSILGVSVRRNKARPVKISKDVFDKDFVKDIEEILRVGPHSCSNNNDRQIANTINENDFISERRNNSCYYIDGVKEICRYLQHLARYDEVESIINHIVHATQIEITPSILSQNLELLLLLTHNKKRQKLLEMFLNIVNHHKRTSIIHYFSYYLVMDLLSPLVDSILTGVALEPITKCLTEKKPKLDNYIVLSRNQSVFLEIQYPVRSNNESFCMDTSAIVVLCKVVASQKFHQECTNSTSGDSSRDNKIDIISANSIKINSEVDLKWYKLLQAFKTSMNFITVPAINKYVIPAMSSYCELDNLETTKVIATLLPARVIIKLLCTYSYFTEEAAYGCLMVLDEWLSNSILSLEAIIQIGNTMLVSNTTDSLRRSLNFLLEDGDTNANRVNNVANSIQNSILLNLLSSNTTGTKEMGVIEIDLTSISNSAEQQTQDRMDEDTLNNSQSSILHSDMNEVEVVSSDFHNGGANFEDILKNDLYRDYGEDYVPDNVFNSILIEFLVNHYSLHGSSKIEGYYDSSYQPSSCYEEIFQSFYSKISNDNGSDVVIQITEHLTSSLLIMPIFNDRRNLINESFLWVVLEICGYYLQQVPNSRCALLRLILSQRLDDQYFGSHKKLAKRLEKQGAELDSTNAEDILTRRKMVLCTCLLRENEQNTSALVVSFEKLVVERSEIDPGVGYENILLQILHGSIIELTEDKAKIVSDTIANFSSDSRSNNKFLSIIPLILSSLDVLAMNAKQLQLSSGDYWYDRNHTSTSLQNGATYQYLFKVIDGIINFASGNNSY